MPRELTLPSDIRRALLDEHARLRRLLEELEELAARELQGDALGRRLPALAGQLARALESHNAAEESVLEPLLRGADAQDAVRVDDMLAEHRKEHAAMVVALDAPAHPGANPEVAREVLRATGVLRAHMDHEERTFLALELLRDDTAIVEPSS